MILYLLIFYFFGVSLATNISSKNSSTTNSSTTHNTNSSSHDFTKKILCNFKGNMDESDSTLVDLDPTKLPKECDIITYSRFSINIYAQIDCDEDLLKSVTDLNKPVLVALQRDYYYIDWVTVFSANDTNPSNEVKVLCDFAKSHNIMGYIVKSVAPEYSVIGFNEDVGKKIVSYIKQLKKCNLVIGLAIYAAPSSMKNPCVYNYEELNNIVDFYKIETFQLNQVCDPNIYNGLTPISKSDHGPNYYYGMEEVVSYLKETKISLTKLVFDIEMYPYDSSTTTYNSYAQVCSGKFDNSTWCVQTSLDFYNKGKFVHDQNAGVLVAIMDLDDVNNDCACTAAFNGFKNIYAGYTGGSTSPCQHFDVQSFEYLIK